MPEPRAYAEEENKYLESPSVTERIRKRKSVLDKLKDLKPVKIGAGDNGEITVRFVREGNKHVANDIKVGHTKFRDIANLPKLLETAKYLKSEPNSKPDQGSKFKRKIKRFHYYEIEVNGRKSYLNIGQVVSNGRTYYCLYAITDYMRE